MAEDDQKKNDGGTDDTTKGSTDGTVTNDKDSPRMVPESDLLAVKNKITGLEEEVTDWKGRASKIQDDFTFLKVRHDGVADKLKSLDDVTAELGKTKELLAASIKSREELETSLLDSKRASLMASGVKDDFLKGKTLGELTLVEQAVKGLKGSNGSNSKFDLGSSGAGSTGPQTELESDLAWIERAKKTQVTK